MDKNEVAISLKRATLWSEFWNLVELLLEQRKALVFLEGLSALKLDKVEIYYETCALKTKVLNSSKHNENLFHVLTVNNRKEAFKQHASGIINDQDREYILKLLTKADF